MLTLLIARHGNTFDAGDIVLRVGKKTDLSLSQSGREQAHNLGIFLQKKYPKIERVIASQLQRTQQTASIALPAQKFEVEPIFDEIDYGIDEGQPESVVIQRIGKEALQQWEKYALSPAGWLVDPQAIIQDWRNFAQKLVAKHSTEDTTLLVVTSNGIARFAPSILDRDNVPALTKAHALKMHTGAVSALCYCKGTWQLLYWNVRPGMTEN